MYKSSTADDFRKHLNLPEDYSVEGMFIFGTYKQYPYEIVREILKSKGLTFESLKLEDEFLKSIYSFKIDDKIYWFVVAYGGAILSEYVHLASMFGSKKNIHVGSCGGLKKGASSLDIIIPAWSYASESSANTYSPDVDSKHTSDKTLSDRLAGVMDKNHTVHRGHTTTSQAMLAESWEHIVKWADEGYDGVEMEASTVFAVSNHFKVPSVAILMIADNLIEKETVLSANFEKKATSRSQVTKEMLTAAIDEILS